jgi:hypothetical protein
VAITAQNSPLWEALAGAFADGRTVLGAQLFRQVVYRKPREKARSASPRISDSL